MTRQKPIPLPQQYCAETVRSDGDRGRLFVDGLKRRTEAIVDGTTRIVISRPDLQCLYTLFPDTNTYISSPLTAEMLAMLGDEATDQEWELVGDAVFDGMTVKQFDVFLPGDSRRCEIVYVDPETGIRVRTVTFNRNGDEVLTIETRNVIIGPPPKEVFELPNGIKQIG